MPIRRTLLAALIVGGLAFAASPALGANAAPVTTGPSLSSTTAVADQTATPPSPGSIQNDEFWHDTSGNPIYSQGGGVFKFGNTYYWYGVKYKGAEEYLANPTTLAYSNDATFEAITVYSSTDLVNWKFENDAATTSTKLNIPASKDVVSNAFSRMTTLADASWIGRIGAVYNANTHKYVIAAQMETSFDSNTKTKHSELFLQSDTPAGDFTYANLQTQIPNVLYQGTGDQTVFTDDDGTSYLVFSNQSGRAHEYVAEFNPADSLSIEPATNVFSSSAGREGNTMFKMDGHYFIASSDLHGWNASATHVIESVGSDPMGPYNQTEFTLPGTENDFSHTTQTGFFFTVHGTKQDTVVFAGDRWSDFAWNGLGYNDWMPLTDTDGSPSLNSVSNWKLNAVTGEWQTGSTNNYILNPDISADRVSTSTIAGWMGTAAPGTASTFVNNTGPGADGSRFAMTLGTGSAAFSGSVTQHEAIPAGTYTFSTQVKTAGNLDTAQAVITDNSGTKVTVDLNTGTGGSWKTVAATGLQLSGGPATITIQADDTTGTKNLSVDQLSLIPDENPWETSVVYEAGATVAYDGSIWEATWWTQNQTPGDPSGPWQELATAGSNTTLWTASRIFTAGSTVTYLGHNYTAQWWTRNQTPGDPSGPWKRLG